MKTYSPTVLDPTATLPAAGATKVTTKTAARKQALITAVDRGGGRDV